MASIAKCKDCKFLKRIKLGKLTRHKCENPKSNEFGSQRYLNDVVCKEWEL